MKCRKLTERVHFFFHGSSNGTGKHAIIKAESEAPGISKMTEELSESTRQMSICKKNNTKTGKCMQISVFDPLDAVSDKSRTNFQYQLTWCSTFLRIAQKFFPLMWCSTTLLRVLNQHRIECAAIFLCEMGLDPTTKPRVSLLWPPFRRKLL